MKNIKTWKILKHEKYSTLFEKRILQYAGENAAWEDCLMLNWASSNLSISELLKKKNLKFKIEIVAEVNML